MSRATVLPARYAALFALFAALCVLRVDTCFRHLPGTMAGQLGLCYTRRRKYRLSTPVLAGLDPAIGYPQPIANDAIPISNHPMKMTGSSPVMTGSDHCVRYVNSKGGWY